MLVKNSTIYGVTAIIRGVLGFLVISVYTRLMVPAEYGDYAVIIAVISLIDALGFMWLRHTLMRHIKYDRDDSHYLSNIVIIYIIVALLCLAASFLTSMFFRPTNTGLFILIGILIIFEASSNFIIFFVRMKLQNRLFFIISILKPLVTLVSGAVFLHMGYGIKGALFGILVSAVICTLSGVFSPYLRNTKLSFYDRKTAVSILLFGTPLIIASSMQFAVKATDRVLIELFIGGDATGLYSVAQDIPLKIMVLIMSSIHLAAYPLAVKKLEDEGIDACREQLAVNFTLLLAISLPTLIGLCVLAPGFITIVVGEEFRKFTVGNIVYFSLIAFINCLSQFYFALSFQLSKRTKLLVIPFSIALLVNLGVGYIGILQIGVMGAAVGSFLAYVILLAVIIFTSRQVFPMVVPFVDSIKIIISSMIMGAVLLHFRNMEGILTLLLSITTGTLIYFALLFVMNVAGVRRGK